jgi:hypothetical protein
MKNMSRTKVLLMSSLLSMSASPLLAHAESVNRADASLDACVKAFVSTNFQKERRYSVVTSNTSGFDPQTSAYRISLAATGKESGKKLGRATCTVDRNSVVLSTNGKNYVVPTSSESPVLSAR